MVLKILKNLLPSMVFIIFYCSENTNVHAAFLQFRVSVKSRKFPSLSTCDEKLTFVDIIQLYRIKSGDGSGFVLENFSVLLSEV